MTSKNTSSEKSLEFIIWIAHKLQNEPNFNSILLANSLFLVDYLSYQRSGKPISDLNYAKDKEGISPISSSLEYMKLNSILEKNPNLDVFDEVELKLIEEVIDKVKENNFNIPEHNKSLLAWRFAKYDEQIPFYTYQYYPNGTAKQNQEIAKNIMKE